MAFYQKDSNFIILQVAIKPQAKTNAIKGIRENRLSIELKAKPVDGAANHELIKFLACYFKLRQKELALLRGEKSRKKVIRISSSPFVLDCLSTLEKQFDQSPNQENTAL